MIFIFSIFAPTNLGRPALALNVAMTTGPHVLQIDLRLSDAAAVKEKFGARRGAGEPLCEHLDIEFMRFAALAWITAALNYAVFAAVLLALPGTYPLVALVISSLSAAIVAYICMRFAVFTS